MPSTQSSERTLLSIRLPAHWPNAEVVPLAEGLADARANSMAALRECLGKRLRQAANSGAPPGLEGGRAEYKFGFRCSKFGPGYSAKRPPHHQVRPQPAKLPGRKLCLL